MTKKEKLNKFIEDKKIDWNAYGSDFNGQAIELAGYACFLDMTEEEVVEIIRPYCSDIENRAELIRVFNYAKANNYGDFWKSKDSIG